MRQFISVFEHALHARLLSNKDALPAGGGKRSRGDDDGDAGLPLTERASACIEAAIDMARIRGNLEVTPLHLFLALFEEGGQNSILRLMLKQAGSEQRAEEARQLITESLERAFHCLAVQRPPPPDLDMSGKLELVLQVRTAGTHSQKIKCTLDQRR